MKKEINLEEILRNKIGYLGNENNLTKLISERAVGSEVLSAMKEACKQTLELASERAKIISGSHPDSKYDTRPVFTYEVDKQSILDTIKQIEP